MMEGIVDLDQLVWEVEKDPSKLDKPELAVFKEFLLSWGCTIPGTSGASSGSGASGGSSKPEVKSTPAAASASQNSGVQASTGPSKAEKKETKQSSKQSNAKVEKVVTVEKVTLSIDSSDDEKKSSSSSSSDDEADPDKNDPERLPEDPPPYPSLGPPGEVELSDQQLEKQAKLKQEATEATEDGKNEGAIKKYTAAIEIGNASALMFAKRAELLLKCKRPRACINDCNAAIKLNSENAKAWKTRGKAYRKLCKWEEAFRDLTQGQSIDFDEEAAEVHAFVSEKWKVITDSKNKQRWDQEQKIQAEKEKKKAEEQRREERKAKKQAEEEKKAYEEHMQREAEAEAERIRFEEDPEWNDKDDPERLPEDSPPYPSVGPPGEVELSEKQMDRQSRYKKEAMEALEDDDRERAVERYTKAIEIGNASALMFAKRADLLLKCKRPRACINDCDAAIKLNSENAKAYKLRGKAYRKLCKWEEAFKDLSKAQSLDFDEDIAEVQELVSKKWKAISERRNKMRLQAQAQQHGGDQAASDAGQTEEQKRKAKRDAVKAEVHRKRDEECSKLYAQIEEQERKRQKREKMPEDTSPKKKSEDPEFINGLMNHPDLGDVMLEPGVMSAFLDVVERPENFTKYASRPKIMSGLRQVRNVLGPPESWGKFDV
eukprot:gnl/MRDRNA2_/MRDRNA2_91773_c0_seq1.p1 gnl/MRDRNA2_/MRDRNA2_91773_c0~~gnl/MRDRNA2_/MRDRNA2_91773_c0_seq1.p1  ORF type:complete len:659 (+),score=208.93 gnl/MRDRNA2_/MRDRNA2_91773_c0_seq1:87-2063(+)